MAVDSRKGRSRLHAWRPVITLALLSFVVCGLAFPVIVTGISQAVFPYQANGDLAQLQGKDVGSFLIAQNFTSPAFFHVRNGSASGVDPDITVQNAMGQAKRVSKASGIPLDSLDALIADHEQFTGVFAGQAYVDVLQLNLALISEYPSSYPGYA